MLPNGKWGIRDTDNFMHVVEHIDKQFFGHENLTHCIHDHMERPYILSTLLFKIEQNPDQGSWGGYAWIKMA